MNMARSTTHDAIKRYRETLEYNRKPGSGRPKATNPNEDRYMVLRVLRERNLPATSVAQQFVNMHGRQILAKTVGRRLKASGLISSRPATGPRLLRMHRVERLHFANDHRDWRNGQWSCVLFTDESRFNLCSPDGRERVWRRRGERFSQCCISKNVTYGGGGVMIWAGVCTDACTELVFVENGRLTADRYINECLADHVVPFGQFVGDNFVLMHDNARPHIAHAVGDYLQEVGIHVLPWPARSPDMNPIEHMRAMLGRRVKNRRPRPELLQELRRALGEEWELIPQEDIANQIESMPRRMDAVIQARGENQRETDNKNNIITLSDEAEMAQSHSDVEVVEETDGRGNSSAPNEDASSGTDDEGTDGTDSGGDESDSDSHHTDDDDNDEDDDDDDDDDDAVHNTPSHSSVKEEQESESTGNEKNIPFTSDKNTKLDLAMIEKLPPYLPAIQGCRNVDEFQTLNKLFYFCLPIRIEEGSYGVVFRAMDKHTEEVVALKRLKMDKEKEGFPITSLREINTLLKAQHPNIVTVREIVMGSNMDKIFIVMDYVEHDLKSLMASMKQKNQFFSLGEVKCLMQQLLRAVAHLHDNWILHRDLKTSNLLLSHKGILKVGDFGLAREYGSPLKAYTSLVVTLWYRAPELLLGAKKYSTPIDMWSVGCIFAELLSMEPLFQGKSEAQQLSRIFKVNNLFTLGTPNEEIWPGFSNLPVVQKVKFVDYPTSQLRTRFSAMISDVGIGLMNRFLTYDPAQRISAEDAIHHDYFMEGPLPIDPSMFPTWPAKSEIGHRNIMAASPKLPSGHEYKGDTSDDIPIEGFHMGVTEKGHVESGPAFRLKF
ncbi:hypothetical protein ANN_19556 [Periplaneta americana]|uniref:Protein kinase domain-containing protein n=1 Tax=Periplaneta americana TaxID=6978 RepID=A0ABQ8SA89_PERAM|nr:hypothetical protein ANN_19556 [Periplaneta americana]